MNRILWIITTLMVYSYVVQTAVVKYTECPEGCECEIKSGITVMSCATLLNESNLINIPVIHFEVAQSRHPFNITKSAFNNLALNHVNSITIFNSSILTIEKYAFSNLTELSYLKIAHSNVSYISPRTFESNSNLRHLNLTSNPLKIDPFLISNSIEELDMSHCNITVLGENTFTNLSQLTYLDLSNNNINVLNNKTFSTLLDMVELRIAHNNLKEISKDIFITNKKLEVLDLSFNPLLELPEFNLPDLQSLNLQSCSLKHLSTASFKNMDYLTDLDVSNNAITNIDSDAFSSLKQLTSINLAGNQLRSQLLFTNNYKLEKIVLDNNTELNEYLAKSFKPISKYYNIHYFSCNNCGLLTMPMEVFQTMPTLVTLLLSNNKISDISTDVFKYLPHLVVLDLSSNNIHTIKDDTFARNINLNKLVLSGNPLGSMHAAIFEYNQNLEYLDLSQCGLYKLWTSPPGSVKIDSLVSLNVSGNKFKIIERIDIAVASNLKVLDISENPLLCTDELKMLIQYLQEHAVTNGNYLTHEKQMDVSDFSETNTTNWRDIARVNCPDMEGLDDDDQDEIELDNYYDDDNNLDIMEDDIPEPRMDTKKIRNLYMWPILVFFGTCLLVIAIVVNTVLFVIRKRQLLTRQHINIKTISRLKKNSGFVYQQLSEERKQQNPIFSKFSLVPNTPKANI